MRDVEYVQARTPDLFKLGELVNRAKGPNRTMAQFAEECGIGASTLSRIANGKISKPISFENLTAIFEHRDPMFQTSFELLASANGMVPKEAYDRIQAHSEMNERRSQQIDRERAIQNIITTALLDRDITISRCNDERILDPGEKMITRTRPSLSLFITEDSSVSAKISEPVWNLYFNTAIVENDPERRTPMSDARWVAMRVLERSMRVFLKDAWYPEKLSNIRTTFVFCDATLYKEFIFQVENAPINSAFTAMLVYINDMKITKDTWISTLDETRGPLSLPVVGTEEYYRSLDFDSGILEDDE